MDSNLGATTNHKSISGTPNKFGKQNYLTVNHTTSTNLANGTSSSHNNRSSASKFGRKRKNGDSAGETESSSDSSCDELNEVLDSTKKVSPKRRRISPKHQRNDKLTVVSRIDACRDLSKLMDCNGPSKEVAAAGASAEAKAVTAAATFESSAATLINQNKYNSPLDKDFINKQVDRIKHEQLDSGMSSGASQESIPTEFSSQEIFGSDPDEIKHTVPPKPLLATSSNASDGAASESSTKSKENLTTQRAYHSDNSDSELCKICNSSSKGAVFVHTNKACSGACYACAKKSWKKYKKCPFCTLKPKTVIKLFSH